MANAALINKGSVQDFYGQPAAPSSPPTGQARAYYNQATDQFHVVDSNGADVCVAGTAATQTGYNNSTSVATTKYVDTMLGANSFATAWFRDDFIASAPTASLTTAANLTYDTIWTGIDIGAAAAVAQTTGTFANPGMITITTGAVSGNGASIYKAGGASSVAVLGAITAGAPWEINFYNFTSSQAAICARLGFVIAGQNAADAPSAGLWVEFDTANTGNTDSGYTLVGRLATVNTYAVGGNATKPSTSTPDHIRIFSTLAGTISATLNGVSLGTLTSGYTAAAVSPFFQILTRTTAAKSLTIDAVSYMAATGRT